LTFNSRVQVQHGDGRAALGPMLREYIMSEAIRYTVSQGAVLTRTAASQRFGDLLKDENNLALGILKAVSEKQVELITHWMRVVLSRG